MPSLSPSTETPQDEIPLSEYEWMYFATDLISIWLPYITIFMGVIGNVMSLLVTTRKDNRKSSTCIYMAGLAVVDSGVLIIDFFYKTLASHRVVEGMYANHAFLSFVWYGENGCSITSGLFLAEMSVDRAIAVAYPMKAATLCKASRAVKVVVITFVLEMCIHLQSLFVYTLPDPPNGSLLVDFPEARWFELFFNTYRLVLGTILPFTILIIANTVIIFSVRRASVQRKKMSDKGRQEKNQANLTAMLLLTSLAYFICSSPMRLYEVFALRAYDMTKPYYSARFWLEWWACAEIWRLNFAINFYVYFLGGGKKFRDDAKAIFGRCAPKSK